MADTDIAVVGMACRVPGAGNIDEFWDLLSNDREGLRIYSDEELRGAGVREEVLRDPHLVRAGMPVAGLELFDAGFFGFSPREAKIMDPQQRHFLECCWEALENAGHPPRAFDGAVGVFAGSGVNLYMIHNLLTNPDLVDSVGWFLLRHTGNDKDFLATRVSYCFDLRGPSINVQTACSTSLVAVHQAVGSLLGGECDMALAGGVTIDVHQDRGYVYQAGEILSPDGHCRAFDADSKGTVFGNGAVVVALRRLEDALDDGDTVHAVIKGSAVNNDGSRKVSFLAPSVDGHADAVAEAQAMAGVSGDEVTYVEAHGTGTNVGDPIEVEALTKGFRQTTDSRGHCAIGSVKTNIGHLDTAAGAASLVKAILALEHRQIPASLNFESPNPLIDFDSSPFYVNARLTEWASERERRLAGVSSLGVGGTNAHVVVEEAPERAPTCPARDVETLVWSARTASALDAYGTRLAAFLRSNPDVNFSDVAHTLQVGREAFEHRRTLACRSAVDAAEAIEQDDRQRIATNRAGDDELSAAFMFPGGGVQYPNMGLELYETEEVYRQAVDESLALLGDPLGAHLRGLMFPAPDALDEAARDLRTALHSILTIFITEYATAKLWISRGVEPVAMTGHSLGEYTAACIAGVMSLGDALRIVRLRGEIFARMPRGGMLSVPASEEALRPVVGDEVSFAAINAPELCVLSGTDEQLTRLAAKLAEHEIESTRLQIDVAAHSAMLEPFLDEFRRGVAEAALSPPRVPFVSNRSGAWISDEEACDPEYWVGHLRNTVRFADGLSTLLAEPSRVLIEVGPGTTMTLLTRAHLARSSSLGIVPSIRHPKDDVSDREFFARAVGQVWTHGFPVDWSRLRGDEVRRRIPLPTYAFDHERYWVDEGAGYRETTAREKSSRRLERRDDIAEWFWQPVWRTSQLAPLDLSELRAHPSSWLVFASGGELDEGLIDRLRALGQTVTTVRPGGRYRKTGGMEFELRPDEPDDYDSLIAELEALPSPIDRVVHLWSVTANASPGVNELLARGFYSIVAFAQAAGKRSALEDVRVGVVSDGMQSVSDERSIHPAKATLLGPCRVLPKEFPSWNVKSIDLAAESTVDADLIDDVLAEIDHGSAESVVAFRERTRWYASQESCRPSAETSPQPERLRERGVYLVTGGFGGIGGVVARDLAEKRSARLVLIGRTALPPQEQWDAYLQDRNPNNPHRARIRRVRELERLGAEVRVEACDIADNSAVRALVGRVKEAFGEIHGVIHAAGVIDDQPVLLKSRDSLGAVLRPKVHGTLALAEALRDEPLDFMVLFSSTSAVLGLPGQADYTAANAFLNAYARSRSGSRKPYVVAVGWGTWAEVGIAAAAARAQGLVDATALESPEPIGHPLVETKIVADALETVYRTQLNVDRHWVLDEHRIKGRGPLLPGTGYLEIAKAAYEGGAPNGAIRIQDLVFISPLEVLPGETREVRVRLERDDGHGLVFEVQSVHGASRDGAPIWHDHARGRVSAESRAPPPPVDLAALERRLGPAKEAATSGPQTRQENHLEFGPRWRVLRATRFCGAEALADLELPEEFERDLNQWALHPALLDLATGYALPLVEGYERCDDLFVPFAYEEVRVYAPLERRIRSWARNHGDNRIDRDSAAFDITITAEDGRVLVEVENFVVRRIERKTTLGESESRQEAEARSHDERPESDGEFRLLEVGVREGIRPQEGVRALELVLTEFDLPEVFVSSLDLWDLIEKTRVQAAGAPKPRRARAKESASSDAPRGRVETRIADVWGELLGVDEVLRTDEFFDLGGHSLLGLRVIARINKEFETDFPSTVLFEHPTVEMLAQQVLEAHPELAADDAPVETPSAGASRGDDVADVEAKPETCREENHSRVPVLAQGDDESDVAVAVAVSRATSVRESGSMASAQESSEVDTREKASAVPTANVDIPRLRQRADELGSSTTDMQPTGSDRPYRMREHWLAKQVLAPLFKIRRGSLRRILQKLILKLEGGEWFTVTLRKLYLEHYGMQIGDYSASCFDAGNLKPGTSIGRYCSIFPSARIETANHPTNTISMNGIFYRQNVGFSPGYAIPRNKVEIGHDVWIGHNATILYPCKKIGDGAVIGAGALVTFDVPPFAIVGGYPATIIRYRFPPEKIDEIIQSRWWERSLEELEDVREEFVRPVVGKTVR